MKKLDRGEIRSHLIHAFRKEVRPFLMKEGREMVETIRKNPRKDDVTTGFDSMAEKKITDYFAKLDYPVRILGEENGEVQTKKGTPLFSLYVDPVDGSTNFKRGIESTAVAFAVIPWGVEVSPRNVEVALVGSVWSGRIFHAVKGEGSFDDETRVEASKVARLEKALIGIDLDFNKDEMWKWNRIAGIIQKAHMIRRGGSAALDTAYVATSAYDAVIDVRDKSTAENFMAHGLLIGEAGGLITDALGKEIGDTSDLSKVYNWVASGNTLIHEQILKTLEMRVRAP